MTRRGSHSNFGLGRVTCTVCGKPVTGKQAAELRQDAPRFELKVRHLDPADCERQGA